MKVFRLNEQGEDEEVSRSGFFPNLDPDLLLRYIAKADQYDPIQEFTQAIRK